ncbi:unnamed protein product [Tilletia controversa]|uniref:F-box domain-containing protein n=3 Tax=Tilletia TaxID=13289 RepID=A0A8X7MSI5_9BASI|nr:hypothetical protein CF336_g3865 [Tilletia laevis]KAE8198577.1 hypothetical protein CF328_g3512 [Tilletia controversa]KAE8261505.1 hypothetical protein A4X03_0g3194 [Tilletia caries]KAE8203406.1 hypothetical protein CF335_g3029 [Tilletia laevis]KAE8247683.1 hypothetical protein A4X06_0g4270 [Tilletia controversa]
MAGKKLEMGEMEKREGPEASGSVSKRPRISAPRADEGEETATNNSRSVKYQAIKDALSNDDVQAAVELSTEVIDSEGIASSKWLQPFYLARSKTQVQLGQKQASLADAKLAIRADPSDPRGYLQAALCLKEVGLEKNCRAALALAREKWTAASASLPSTAIARFNTMAKEIEGGLTKVGIARMPVEVLIRIFLACDGDTFTLIRMERVCRRWRQILRNAPDPWKQVHLWHPQGYFLDTAVAVADVPAEPASSLPCKKVRRALQYADTRSGQKITSVQLDLRKGHLLDLVSKIQQVINQNKASIQNLKLCILHPQDTGKFSPCVLFPKLHSFLLSDGMPGNSVSAPSEMLPCKELSIRHLVMSLRTNIPTSFTALRTLVIAGGIRGPESVNELLEAIRPSQDTIQHLRIGYVPAQLEATQTTLTLPKLQSFEATSTPSIGPSGLWRRIKAPNLKMISVVSVKHDEMASLFKDLCNISQLEQVSISLAESPITAVSRRETLSFISQLVHLNKLDISAEGNTQILDDIIACLAPTQWIKESVGMPGAASTFLPALSTLIIRKHPSMTGSQLMRSVAARLPQEIGMQGPPEATVSRSQSGARPVSSAFKRAASASTSNSSAAAVATDSSLDRRLQEFSACQPIKTLILYRCPTLDPKAEEWLQAKVPDFAHIQLDRSARQRAEASSRSIKPW